MSAIAAVSVLALSSPVTASADASRAPSSPTGTVSEGVPPGTHSVTLITGDVVTTRPSPEPGRSGGTVVVRGPGGSPAQARVTESGGDLYVYPESALPYVAGGILDRRLFNITDLVADGYDDAHRPRLPLIVAYAQDASGLRASGPPPGATRVRDLAGVQGAALSQDRARSADFWSAVTAAPKAARASSPFAGGITRIWLDGVVKADLADTTAQIGAPEVWAGGDTGQGVDVAVLDTGVDTGHPDLAGRLAATRSFVPEEDAEDHNGHGTHVASTVAGTGAASDGREKGVAPGAELHIGKVLSNGGSGMDSWVLAGMEWAAVDQHAKVINMSLGSDVPSDGTDPLSAAVDRLSAQTGALFVVAAGNTGAPYSISGPGAADAALTVGAVDSTDAVASFSSQGPRVGDGALKPEITAPGVDVLAARSRYASEGEGDYQTLSGTSMATPHAAGAAALLAAAHPELDGRQLKDLLTSTSRPTPSYDAFQGGSGRLDVAAAAQAGVFASATAFAGQVKAGASGAVDRPVTYTNTTATPVTLDLAVAAPSAPDGMFRLSAGRVVVPAHGTAAVTVTIDGSRASGDERYSGQVLATGPDGHVAAHTAVSLGDVAHKLTMVLKDAHGEPMPGVVQLLRSGQDLPEFWIIDESGTAETYLPNDVYSVLAFKAVQGVHGPSSQGMALLGDPEVKMDQDTTVTLDAGKIRRVDMTTPQKAEVTYQRLEYFRSMGGWSWRDYMEVQTSYDSLWAQPTTDEVTHGDFYLAARWRKELPALSVSSRTTDFTDVLRQDSVTPLPEGRYKLPAVYAGDGASADYAGLDARGKAVVVRRTSAVADADQAAAAARAGAKLLLVRNDEPGRRVRPYNADPLTPAPIDVALLSTDEGDRLIQQVRDGRATLTVDSRPVSPYVYDLMRTWHNEIPSDLVVQGGPKNLARVDVTFAGPGPERGGGEYRFDWPSYSEWGIGTTMREPVKGRRVDWVSTGAANAWGQEAYVDGLIYEIEPRATYRPGSTRSQEWFKPIERPHLNDNYKLPSRSGNWLSLDVPGYGGADHVGMSMDYQLSRQTLTLYQGETRLAQGTGTVVGGTAPADGLLPYRLVVDNSRDAAFSPYSSTTHTDWTFTSQAPAQQDAQAVLPLIQLDYEIATDDAGRAARNATLSVSATALPRAAGAGRIGPVTLDLSYDDGRTWHRVTCDHDGRYRLSAPRTASFMSLRAGAKDSAGNAVTQTITRATGLH
ncbi:S8 family serine peptidase [Sphaerisporangium sp. NPDC005288]|uniref:S8 family peptidase n=1 Tax=Sphaerisporangium sp. NPDC005288 TaxID=3155114 RepID=UPI0033BAAF43